MHRTPEHAFDRKRDAAVGFLLLALVWTVFAQTLAFDFLEFDDNVHVFDNPAVREGFTIEGLAAIIIGPKTGIWHPVTWFSHMTDCQIFGLKPAGHHLTNVLLHAANCILLYLFLVRATGQPFPSALVAALFAVHPLHVEPVAWISSRKDVLSGFFALLTLHAYARYAARPGAWRYAAVAGLFVLGLMSKPMLMTLPFLLLLLDVWPLQRVYTPEGRWTLERRVYGRLLLEKVPLIALSAAMGVVSILASRQGGSFRSLEEAPLLARLLSPPIHYVKYLLMTFWPAHLAAPYPPLGTSPPLLQSFAATALLAAVTALLASRIRTRPSLIVGWLWFLGMLVPVIGFVPVGIQSMADRYLYLPLAGLAIAIVWGLADLATDRPRLARALAASSVAVLLALTAAAAKQTRTWRSTETVFARAVEVMPENVTARVTLAEQLMQRGGYPDAIAHLDEAIRLDPADARAYVNLGAALEESGKPAEAVSLLESAIALIPNNPDLHNNLGNALAALERYPEAIAQYDQALETNPRHANALNGKGALLLILGQTQTAAEYYRHAIALRPESAQLHHNFSIALSDLGRKQEALEQSQEALRFDPNYQEAQQFMAFLTTPETPRSDKQPPQ